MPVDAPSVLECSDDNGTILGGTGQDLAQQVFEVLTQKLDLTLPELVFLQGEWERNCRKLLLLELIKTCCLFIDNRKIFHFSRTC